MWLGLYKILEWRARCTLGLVFRTSPKALMRCYVADKLKKVECFFACRAGAEYYIRIASHRLQPHRRGLRGQDPANGGPIHGLAEDNFPAIWGKGWVIVRPSLM